MYEHRAAAAGHPRAGVVVDLDDEIVEVVLPPKPVAWFSGRAAKGAVITSVSGILAPGDIAGNASQGQQGTRPRGAPPAHQSGGSRNRPRGVAPSPSNLLARTPARPSTTGMARGPATRTP